MLGPIGLPLKPAVLHLRGGAAVDGEASQDGEGVSLHNVHLLERASRSGRVLQAVNQQGAGRVLEVEAATGRAPHLFHHAGDGIAGGVGRGEAQKFLNR